MQSELVASDIPIPIINQGFVEDFKRLGVSFSEDPQDRIFRAHGMQSSCNTTVS